VWGKDGKMDKDIKIKMCKKNGIMEKDMKVKKYEK
jgi:hypothetical protein